MSITGCRKRWPVKIGGLPRSVIDARPVGELSVQDLVQLTADESGPSKKSWAVGSSVGIRSVGGVGSGLPLRGRSQPGGKDATLVTTRLPSGDPRYDKRQPMGRRAAATAAFSKGEFLAPATAPECFAGGRPIAGRREDRGSEGYRQRLRQVLGFAPEAVALERHIHFTADLTAADRRLLEKVFTRCSEAFWIEDTPHTMVK